LNFVNLSWSKITDKLEIKWQNIARVRLQLKLAFGPRVRKRLMFFNNEHDDEEGKER